MDKLSNTAAVAAILMRSSYGCYARPARDTNGDPMLLVWGSELRDGVDLDKPDHRIVLGRSGLTWLMDNEVIAGVDVGASTLAGIVGNRMFYGGGEANV